MAGKADIGVLLSRWDEAMQEWESRAKLVLERCAAVGEEYDLRRQELEEKAFNVFNVISDKYYLENFHSDIIRFFLDSQESHGEGNLYARLFVEMLNKAGCDIDAEAYSDASAVREKEKRIDILLSSERTGRAIIIENKINNAPDTARQLPRYLEYASVSHKIDAIVYLPAERSKTPDMNDWTGDDKARVLPLLRIIPAFDRAGSVNLVDDWLAPAEAATSDADVRSVIGQYSRLIRKLNSKAMDAVIMEKFYNELKNEEDLKVALSVRNMLNDLPGYLALRLYDRYAGRCHPFSKVWIYKSFDTVFEQAVINGVYLKMDIWCSEGGYDVYFWSPDDQNPNEAEFHRVVGEVAALRGFEYSNDSRTKVWRHFSFFDEAGLHGFIGSLLSDLSELAVRKR